MGLLANYLPDWLPDDPNKNDAARQGLLQFGAALLGGRGNFGAVLGQGIQAGSAGYQSALNNSSLAAVRDAQLKGLNPQNQGVQGAMDQQKGILSLLNGSGSPPPAAPSAPSAASQLVAGGDASTVAPLSSLPQMSPAADTPLNMVPKASTVGQFVTPPVSNLPQVGQAMPAQPTQGDAYQAALAQAQLIKSHYGAEAAKLYFEQADKLRPKVNGI